MFERHVVADIVASGSQFDKQEVHKKSSAGQVGDDQTVENMRVAGTGYAAAAVAVEAGSKTNLAHRWVERYSFADQPGQGHAWKDVAEQKCFA